MDGAQAVPSLQQDRVVAPLAGLRVDAVQVPVPADLVAGGGLAEFVRDGVADSTGGPVLLVAQGNPAAGVVVSPGQGSALAQGVGRDVVAVTPGQGGRGPQWTVFGADGSARPVTGTGAPVPAGNGQGVAGLADASTAVPDSGQQAVVPNETAAVQTASVASAGGRGSGEPVTDASGQTHQNPDEEFRASRQADDRTDTTGGETAEQSGETEPVAGPREAAYYNALWHGGKEPGVEDRAWQHTQARQASWFDPLPRPLKPGAWEHLRNTIPDGKADFEVGDVRMSSRPNRLVTGKGAVSYDWRRFEVAPGRGVQEFTFNAHLNSGEFLTPFRERAERELRLAEEAENAADNAAVAVRQLEQQLDSSPGNAGVLARAQADADTARQRADAQRDKAREAGVELDQRQHVLNDLKRRAADSVDELYNQGYRMAHSGDQFHFRLEFVDDPAEAHRSIGLRTDPNAGTNQVIWNPHTLGSTVAHELGHYLGLPDEYFEPGTYTLGRRQTEDGVSLPEYTVRTYLDTDVYLNPLREAVGADERWAAEAKTDAARESNDAALRDEAQRLRAKADESKQRLADAQREVDELKDRAISGVAELFRPERMHPDARYFVKLEFSDNRAESNFLVDLRQSANDDPGGWDIRSSGYGLAATVGFHLGLSPDFFRRLRRDQVGDFQERPKADNRLVFNRADPPMPTDTATGWPHSSQNSYIPDDGLMTGKQRAFLPRNLWRIEEVAISQGLRPDVLVPGPQRRARTLDHLLSRDPVDESAVLRELAALRGDPAAVQEVQTAFLANTGDTLDVVLRLVLGEDGHKRAVQHLVSRDWDAPAASSAVDAENYRVARSSGDGKDVPEADRPETTGAETAERGGEIERASARGSSPEPETTPADPQTASTATTRTARQAREQSASSHRAGGLREFGGRSARSDEEFLAGDLSESSVADVRGEIGRAREVGWSGDDESSADNLLSATVTAVPGIDAVASRGRQSYHRRVAIGKALSGLRDDAAVERLLRDEARAEGLLGRYDTRLDLEVRFNRGKTWAAPIIGEVRRKLTSDLEASVNSLRQILAEAETTTGLRIEYEAKIAMWLPINQHTGVNEIHRRAGEAAAAVPVLREQRQLHNLTAVRDWDKRYKLAEAQLDEWAGIAGRAVVAGLLADADGVLGPLKVSRRFRVVLAQWLGEHPGDWRGAQAVRGELAGYLAGDPVIGLAVSGLTRDVFEAVRAEEQRWQGGGAGNQADAGAIAAPMVRGVDDDPALRVISRVSSVKRAFADAGRALRQLADEQGHGVVDGLYAAADEVLGSLKESQPFRDVMAHELMTSPPNLRDQQVQELRGKLVRYLAGDLSGGADSSSADNLLSATVTAVPGIDAVASRGRQSYHRRVAIGKALSGLRDDAAVERLLRDEARAEGLLGRYDTRLDLEVRFNRGKTWAAPIIGEVRRKLTSDLEASVNSLRQILAEAETTTGLRIEYEAKIAMWLPINQHTGVNEIHRRAGEAAAAVPVLREQRQLHNLTAVRDWDKRYKLAEAQLDEWAGIAGREVVAGLLADADGVLGPLKVSRRGRGVLAQWLGEHPGDWRGAQAVRGELAGYLAGDPVIGLAGGGVAPDVFEAVRAEEQRWQGGGAGNQADAGAIAAPMVRGVDDDPALRVISRVSSVKRAFADAGRALRQLADEQGHGVVDGLYAAADEVLGSLKESQPFRDVMAHELMTSPPKLRDQQVQELRGKLVRYLAGDLGGGADSSTADDLLSATVARVPGNTRSERMQRFQRRVAVGMSFSGLLEVAVDRVLRTEAVENALREDFSITAMGARFNRSREWGRKVLNDVKQQLSSDLEAAVGSLRQILTEAEASTDLWNAYEAQIAQWLDLDGVRVDAIRSRVEEAVAVVQGLREWFRDNAIPEMRDSFETAGGELRQLEALHGPDPVGYTFAGVEQRFRGMQDDQLRNAVPHRLLTHGGHIGDAQALLRDWDQLYERAAAQVHEWAGIAGREAVAGLLADADGILGPLAVSGRFRMVLAQWLGEHPGDWRGAQAVRGELAGYLAGDPDFGVAVSGLPPGAFEEARAEETRRQADHGGNQAEVVAPMVRGVDDDPALRVISEVVSVRRTFADAGRALRQLADQQGQGVVDGLYAAADEVLGSLKESQPFRDVMAHELMTNPRDDQQLQELRWGLVRYLAGDPSGGADSNTANDLLAATRTVSSVENEDKVREQLIYRRRVAVGKVLSGLPEDAAVDRVLRNEAREYVLREDCDRSHLMNRFNRGNWWIVGVVTDVKQQLSSDLEAAVGSLGGGGGKR
ncbi:hypothetical protein [Saccharopolyspora spinosa]|uniref:hypothetical protein n=1 Tax=Saccharopolyspora spinosa TaxID=60894 RepID=UPI0011D1CE21|nr:hypothetical protein [Saccharopolyspora spinosa]